MPKFTHSLSSSDLQYVCCTEFRGTNTNASAIFLWRTAEPCILVVFFWVLFSLNFSIRVLLFDGSRPFFLLALCWRRCSFSVMRLMSTWSIKIVVRPGFLSLRLIDFPMYYFKITRTKTTRSEWWTNLEFSSIPSFATMASTLPSELVAFSAVALRCCKLLYSRD